MNLIDYFYLKIAPSNVLEMKFLTLLRFVLKKQTNQQSFISKSTRYCLFSCSLIYFKNDDGTREWTHSKLSSSLTSSVFLCCWTLIFISNPLQNLFFKCCGEPRHLHLPLTSTVIWVHSASHSSMLCDVKMIDLLALRNSFMTFHKLRFVAGSKPFSMNS